MIGKWIVIAFGIFIISCGIIMLFAPSKAREILRKAGSTNFINYAEITLRMIPAIGLILSSDVSKFPLLFKLFGWFMLITSLILYFVPRQFHHNYSLKCADILTPFYFRLISPLSFLFGAILIYFVI
jgi:uncharacterized membrane protein YfcA